MRRRRSWAVELMAAFGPDGRDNVTRSGFENWMFRGSTKPGIFSPIYPVEGPILEAIQLLEHAELIYESSDGASTKIWTPTRLGSATLASGKAAIRQRIKDRTGL